MKPIDVTLMVLRFLVGFFIGVALGVLLFSPSDAKALPTKGTYFAIVNEVEHQSARYHLDPDLVLAVIKVESNFNWRKTGSKGEVGLMQLRPIYFPHVKHDLDSNIRQGVKYLAFIRDHCPVTKDLLWVSCYNSGINRHPKHPELLPYYKKVMNVYKEFKSQN